MAWTASEITSDSNFPPPIVPTLRPSSYTTIFAPGSRGAEPVTLAIVAKAHASPFFKGVQQQLIDDFALDHLVFQN